MSPKERIIELLQKHLNSSLNQTEENELHEYVIASQHDDDLKEAINFTFLSSVPEFSQDEKAAQLIFNTIVEVDRSLNLKQHWFNRSLLKYAAAIIIILGAGAYLWTTTTHKESPVIANIDPSLMDITPGGEKAILTLADGSSIILDSASNGRLAMQGNMQIIKSDNGQISYLSLDGKRQKKSESYNTMTTPRGGLYQLNLPDGSKVWLNSASSITYPVSFSGEKREVSITGEVYFEVAKRKDQPFIVRSGQDCKILVLGTNFNINAYANEENLRATLIEGSIKVEIPSGDNNKSVVLKPGQQGQINRKNKNGISVKNGVVIDEIIAWQKGMFVFDNSDIANIARQLSRWYNVEIEIEGNMNNIKFGGGISKNVPLSATLKVLKASGAEYKWSNGKLIFYVR